MKPSDGNYRLRNDPNPPGTPDMRLEIRTVGGASTGACSFGTFGWDGGNDWFKHPDLDVWIRFTSATRFLWVSGNQSGVGSYASE